MGWIKQNWVKIIIIIYVVWLSWKESNLFWIVLLTLGIGIYLILTKSIPRKIINIMSIIIWISVFMIIGLMFYINYSLPHGPSYPTGEIVCQNDDRGPCTEQYKEDMRGLDIPSWAKFIRSSEGWLLWMGLVFVGIALKSKKDES